MLPVDTKKLQHPLPDAASKMTKAASPFHATCDLCDALKNDSSGDFRVLPPVFKSFGGLLVAGFEVQDCWPAHGQGQLPGFTHDAASDEKFCAEMVAVS